MLEFRFYVDLKGETRWRAVDTNGRIVADSAEGYVDEAAAQKGFVNFITHIRTEQYEVKNQ